MGDLNPAMLDDPRRLRDMLVRASGLALEHKLTSVLIGVTGFEGDLLFPDIMRYIESSLRMDDSVFRMTRERAVLLLTDVDEEEAKTVMRRLLEEFRENFPAAEEPAVAFAFVEVSSDSVPPTAKDVLPQLFAGAPRAH